MGMRGFADTQQLAVAPVEGRAPGDQLRHALQAFFDEHGRGWPVHQAIAGGYGVFDMERHIVAALGGEGNAALRELVSGSGNRLRFRVGKTGCNVGKLW